ncbi:MULTISPECIES: hypothetical protein [unclassified Pseudodesulfovibrio]|jgi:hypothetical protein|uniref:hypothetical protein n=1 Tax=unclassified Pseudodesulfovibrio TaxID=2661612 RepID=UPI000FEBA4B7|nr:MULTISPECIES: hypothetical protein [unclassified Pseudodesulfovibrio]MCJ2166029.1 hypothetical protein [Pseudodesulfovibrio sp. S3-i]RWU02533.1 hypothetical protein DWB63_15640 [Pseudodesulfovibrio sp. S3]
MTTIERQDLQDLLVRIDERVKAIQIAIREINGARQCASHQVKIRILERLAWGCLAGMAAMGGRMVFEVLR